MRGQRSEIPEFCVHGGNLGRNEKRVRDCPYVWLLCENGTRKHEVQRKDTKEGEKQNMRAACETTCSCYLHRGREEAEDCEMTTTGKRGEKGFAWARGRVSWDPVVADPPKRGVQSETGLTRDRRSGGATSEECGGKKHRVREHGLPTVPGVRNLKRNELWVTEGEGTGP